MNPLDRLSEVGLKLPKVSNPGGNYVSVNVRNNIAYVAIQFPILDEKYLYTGRLGNELTTNEGYEAMKLCAMNVLAQIDRKVGFDYLIGLNHVDAYYQAGDNWDDSPRVVDGASDLFIDVLGDKGRHSRAIFGVEKLPRNFSVGLTTTFTISAES
ncbi:RidA family protein [Tunicatimonas pelagia]|uniref:RidA family protein n=1 Tax=Tunicatimonas pelagia TaxID=931531 RepID=UPI002665E271|nr:RidA family protein [Tunicatimonas pelagia]WKN41082.1 RidA family protein [Tunicatimonas pelagia]